MFSVPVGSTSHALTGSIAKVVRASHPGLPATLARAAIALALTVALSPLAVAAESLTYKGTLSENDKPANGRFEMQLQLFSDEFGGDQLGYTITLPNVQVIDGSFQVPINLPATLPESQSMWLQAQIKPEGASGFSPLDGRQEITSTTGGGVCWETAGNPTENGGVIGIPGVAPGNLLSLTNRGSSIFLRAGGGVEQSASTAAGARAAAFNSSTAAGPDSFTIGKGTTGAAHSFSAVFADGTAGTLASTAPNQFLIRAQNGVGINTNSPRGALSVQRGGVSGAGAVSPSAITAESDTNMYISLLTPSTQERGILFGDQVNTAMGGIIFNTLSPGNSNGMTFRTGGNLDRMQLTGDGRLLINPVTNANGTLYVKAASGAAEQNSTIRLVHGSGGATGGVFLRATASGGLEMSVQNNSMNLSSRLGIFRDPADNALEVLGNASKSTPGDWLSNSDRRIKQDIAPINNALALLHRIQPVTFRYTDAYRGEHPDIDRDQRYYNVIAQDFAEVFPDAVKGSGEYLQGTAKTAANEILQVDTFPATITAIAAIQELDAKTELNDARVAKLEAENAELRARLATIERRLGVSADSSR